MNSFWLRICYQSTSAIIKNKKHLQNIRRMYTEELRTRPFGNCSPEVNQATVNDNASYMIRDLNLEKIFFKENPVWIGNI